VTDLESSKTSTELEALVSLPVLPLRNTVLFPHLFLPLSAGRPSSLAAVEAALASEDKTILAVALRVPDADRPRVEDLYSVGTKAVIKKMARSGDGIELLVQGLERMLIVGAEQTEPYLRVRLRPLPLPEDAGAEVEALRRAVLEQMSRAVELAHPEGAVNVQQLAAQATNPLILAYLIGSMLSLDAAREQALLEAPSRLEALRLLHGYLSSELQVLELRQKIAAEAQTEMSREQKEYLLRQQLRAIQGELGEMSPEKTEVQELRDRVATAELPDDVRKEVERELGRLERLPAAAPDAQITRSYIELILELPWRKSTDDVLDLDRAQQVLDQDHFDLEKIKERILEHLAVLKLNPNAKAPILCFVGPPGVGKTSLGHSIARALNRKFERMSLGGLHDEAELRGHRRTYISAMPGRILQGIRRAGVNNPVLMLDEVDKVGSDYRGDPTAALLEILDPAQNSTFRDNYLDLPFDLSRVFFVATANTLDGISAPLLDRMELLRLSGYSEEEKVHIAVRYLAPRQIAEAGLQPGQLTIPDETIRRTISGYTREAGVRELERMLARLARKVATRFARGQTEPVVVNPTDLEAFLGPERFFLEQARRDLEPGVATGLAWTEAGGDVLYVETQRLPGARGLRLTGQLGDVMRESARAAQSYIWSHAEPFGVDPAELRQSGVHIHVPAGAVPKDGPSAGVTMATALASLYTRQPVRSDTAMTGEITLTGLVLPVGGIKEKVLAAHRAGIRRVVLPKANEKDLADLPESVREEMEFVLADRIENVVKATIPGLASRLAAASTAPEPVPVPQPRIHRHGGPR
jgi:ATP-dependent Lon protease